VSCVSTLNDNQAKEYSIPLSVQHDEKKNKKGKEHWQKRGNRERNIHIIIRHETQGGWWIPGSCVKQRVPLGQKQRVSLSNLSPCAALLGRSNRSGCLSTSSEGLNQLVAGKNKASSSSTDQNCSAQITLMKYASSLAGEISILMAHQAQLSQIMKIHLHCQSTAVQ